MVSGHVNPNERDEGPTRELLVRDWYTPTQARNILGMSKSTFWRRVHDGSIVARQDGPRCYRVSRRALIDYQEENKTFDPAL
jgi:excisionase family DNA binding protein